MPVHRRVFVVGMLVLVVGWALALSVYLFADPENVSEVASALVNERLQDYNLERVSGKSAVYLMQFSNWLDSLWHGRRLAFTLAGISLVIAFFCFWMAHMLSIPLDEISKPEDTL